MSDEDFPIHEQFLSLFTANEPAIRAFVRRLVATRDDAADVMQGVSLVLWKKFRDLKNVDEFRPWSFGVARYEALAWLRDKARDRLVLADEVLQVVATESLGDELMLSAQRDALEQCLDDLPNEKRALLLAAYTPDVGIQTAAKQSGRTVAAFYQWLYRTRMQLLECTQRRLQSEGLL